jgi:hypothetical protein
MVVTNNPPRKKRVVDKSKKSSNFIAPQKRDALQNVYGFKPERMHKYALKMLDPLGTPETIFPSPVPCRAGSATFPLTVDVVNTGTLPDFGIIAQPDMDQPLRITHDGAPPLSGSTYGATAILSPGLGGYPQMMEGAFEDCNITPEALGAFRRPGLPLVSNDIGANQFFIEMAATIEPWTGTFTLSGWDGSIWVDIYTTGALGAGVRSVAFNVAYGSAYTHFTVRATTVTGRKPFIFVTMQFAPNSGRLISCGTATDENVFDVYTPEWEALRLASNEWRIVAMMALVTYMGSPLNAGGSIACCNAPDDLHIHNGWYSTCASRPFDRYDGRLYSDSDDDGGAHWHYVPDDIPALRMLEADGPRASNMCGFFGIKSLAVGESVRVRLAVTVQFFSINPMYSMTFTPAITDFTPLLYAMREHVPLVSSNGAHLKKIKQYAKHAVKKGLDHALENPQAVAALLAKLAMLL